MLAPRRPDLRYQAAQYIAGRAVDREGWSSLQTFQRRKAPLPDRRILRVLRAQPQLGDRNRRQKDWLVFRQYCYVTGCYRALLNVDPDARIDQERHGSRT